MTNDQVTAILVALLLVLFSLHLEDTALCPLVCIRDFTDLLLMGLEA
jgi:hypothetical protein